uniref:Dynamin-A n=1 Tax=Ganoderma boninense TaxID=34458 RepID=A0A5K1K1H5_9APHY|nr:Dynamin-A [Ganoderma boninense]
MLPTQPSAAGLLAFRLSPDNFKAYIAQSRKCPLGYRVQSDADIDSAKSQSVIVRGFDPHAVAAIKAANDGPGTVLQATYHLGKEMLTVIWQVEGILHIPSEHWRLALKTRLCGVYDSLTGTLYEVKVQAKPVELLLISQAALPRYLAQHEYMRDWKRLEPAPPPPGNSLDPLAQAQATWHLLSPVQDEHWPRYSAHRRNAEWDLALMRQRESLSLTVPPFLDKIKDGVETVLKRTSLSADEQAVVADGILPQALEVWDDGSDGVYVCPSFTFPVTICVLTFLQTSYMHRGASWMRHPTPARRRNGPPSTLDVFVHYPSPCNVRILYRLHDPAPTPSPESQTFRIRSRNTHPQHGVDGWRLLFEMDISQVPKRTRRGGKDVERRTWGLTSADALGVHDALFGTAEAADSVGAKVSVLDAMLLVLAAVGFHMELRKAGADEGARVWDEDRFAYWEGPNWKLGKLEWIGGNLRTVCGAPLRGDKLAKEEVVEDDSD